MLYYIISNETTNKVKITQLKVVRFNTLKSFKNNEHMLLENYTLKKE
jgi:hypothetical protein